MGHKETYEEYWKGETETPKPPTQQEKAKRLLDLLEKLYGTSAKNFRPSRGKILVKLCERDTVYKGSILVPNSKHKPVFEAIVVGLYEPYWKFYRNEYSDSSATTTTNVLIEPIVKIGDHVLFGHYKGAPVPMDEFSGEFRLIDEADVEGMVEYDKKIIEQMETLVGKQKAKKLLDDYVVIPLHTSSKTRSGVEN